MKRSDIYEYILGNARVRVLIISATAFNPRRATFLLVRDTEPATPTALAIPLAAADPGRGAIDASRLRPLDTANLGARIGRLTPSTMAQVEQALRLYLDL